MWWNFIASGVGMGISAVQQLRAGDAMHKAALKGRDASYYAAGLEEWNARVAEAVADDAIARGWEEEQRFRTSVKGIIGAQRAGFAAGNVEVSSGSALDVQADTAYQGEIDALTIRTNAAREAWGYRVAAADYRKRAMIRRMEGDMIAAGGAEQRRQAQFGAWATVGTGSLSLVGSLAKKYNWRWPGAQSGNANASVYGG